jgi:hypothetical protein
LAGDDHPVLCDILSEAKDLKQYSKARATTASLPRIGYGRGSMVEILRRCAPRDDEPRRGDFGYVREVFERSLLLVRKAKPFCRAGWEANGVSGSAV